MHSSNSKVPLFSLGGETLINADPVVSNPHDKIAGIAKFNVEPRASRVRAGVAHCFIANSTHLVSNDRMQVANHALGRQCEGDGGIEDTILARALKRFSQIVPLRGGGSQRSQGGPPFFGCLFE